MEKRWGHTYLIWKNRQIAPGRVKRKVVKVKEVKELKGIRHQLVFALKGSPPGFSLSSFPPLIHLSSSFSFSFSFSSSSSSSSFLSSSYSFFFSLFPISSLSLDPHSRPLLRRIFICTTSSPVTFHLFVVLTEHPSLLFPVSFISRHLQGHFLPQSAPSSFSHSHFTTSLPNGRPSRASS
ncbi:hypothetical protein B0F90DRAFT_117047 [Multifurca ochricompacta]|uniref:Uncharacterized protein n=1 Tax=Multifurca ochricompacta TaxID=376703 RepID=A0AAD4MGU0_9AGAM|nr:hypothetical protein B0F90DRAFT_117047 [Multifurca ochricompacta]